MTQEKPPKKLLDQMRDILRTKHCSIRTEKVHVEWARRFILFHNKHHPKDMGAPEIEAFLTGLAVEENVAASTQNQALNAIVFLYNMVLQQPIDFPLENVRAKRPKRFPAVLTRSEVQRLIGVMSVKNRLMAKLL